MKTRRPAFTLIELLVVIALKMRTADFTGGLSQTLGMGEVKAHEPLLFDGGSPSGSGLGVAPPATPADCLTYGGTFDSEIGHTQWANGTVALWPCPTN